jgi:hypothetical protein
MPYITQSDRRLYDYHLGLLIDDLKENDWVEGHINYIISRIIVDWWRFNKRYSTINRIMGTLSCVGVEFYRKFAATYEIEKEAENGPI